MRTFPTDTPLERIEEALTAIEARLRLDVATEDLAPAIAALLARIGEIAADARAATLTAIRAEAAVDAADAELDDHVAALAIAVRSVFDDPTGARFHRYFQRDAAHVIRLGLASQLEVVRSWPLLLAADSEPWIAAGSDVIARAIARGDEAIAARTAAAVDAARLRVTRVVPLIEDCNAVLAAVAEDAAERAEGKPKGWLERFFR